ncbi:ribonuclease H-like domain-containing protein [Schizophyllum commune]
MVPQNNLQPLSPPPGWILTYVTTLAQAVLVLNQYFSVGIPLPFVSVDFEWSGDLPSLAVAANLCIPVPFPADLCVRVLTLARDSVVVVFDVVALGAIPLRLAEILADSRIAKVGCNITVDTFILLQHYALVVRNAIELSHLYKCLHPSIDQAPLAVQHGLSTLTSLVLGAALDKSMQVSDWRVPCLSGAQILYAQLDGIAACLVYARLSTLLPLSGHADFTANSYSFSTGVAIDGVLVGPAGCPASRMCSWGVLDDGPTASQRWKPQHRLLDQWKGGIYASCRSLSLSAFVAFQVRTLYGRLYKLFHTFALEFYIYILYRFRALHLPRAFACAVFLLSSALLSGVLYLLVM